MNDFGLSRSLATLLLLCLANALAVMQPRGPAPFSLLTYAAVRERAHRIAAVTRSRYMPPSMAEPGHGEFLNRPVLTDPEIALIQRWVDDGVLEGDSRDLPPPPRRKTDGWQLGTPDLIVRPESSYTLRAEGEDAFHVFVIRLPNAVRRFVRGMEFRPDSVQLVHHANILIDHTSNSREQIEAHPLAGEGGLLPRTATYPPGHILGWTPSEPDPLLPDRLSWTLEPKTDLVVQLHMIPSGKPESVGFSIGFFFGRTPPTENPALLRLGRQTLDIPPGAAKYTVSDSYRLPVDATLLALKPHAHQRAQEMRCTATLPDGTVQSLLYIKKWSFRWQHIYRYVEPIALPKGTVVSMEYTFDNSEQNPTNPQRPPRRVRWGPRSVDEMADLWIQVLTTTGRDLVIMNQDFKLKWAAEDIAGQEGLLVTDPDNSTLHNDVGFLYLGLGQTEAALRHFEAVVRTEPGSAAARLNLGAVLAKVDRGRDAEAQFREALRLDPDFAAAHTSLGNLAVTQGRLDVALEEYLAAVRTRPTDPKAQNDVGFMFLNLGQPLQAVRYLSEALRLDPHLSEAHHNLGLVLYGQGDHSAAIRHYRAALEDRRRWPAAISDLAWLLATTVDDRFRSPGEAVALAEQAVALTADRNVRLLDILAAAYAAAGRFDDAVSTAQQALDLDPGSDSTRIRERQALYRSHQAYREGPQRR